MVGAYQGQKSSCFLRAHRTNLCTGLHRVWIARSLLKGGLRSCKDHKLPSSEITLCWSVKGMLSERKLHEKWCLILLITWHWRLHYIQFISGTSACSLAYKSSSVIFLLLLQSTPFASSTDNLLSLISTNKGVFCCCFILGFKNHWVCFWLNVSVCFYLGIKTWVPHGAQRFI